MFVTLFVVAVTVVVVVVRSAGKRKRDERE